MFPLSGKSFPTSADELAAAIRGALEDVFSLPKQDAAVKLTGTDSPAIQKLTIDLDDASVTTAEPPPKPAPAGKRTGGITVDQLHVTGHPVRYENSKLNLNLKAKDVKLAFAKDKKGHPLLVLTDAKDGTADAKISKDDLRSLVLAVAGAAAREQGVTITDVEIDLASAGTRSVAADVRVSAKKAFVKGTVLLTGRADVDDDLNATLSDLSCTGDGMIGNLAAGFLKPHLAKYNGRQFPLMTFSLGDVTLRDLKVDTRSGLHVTAKFGSA